MAIDAMVATRALSQIVIAGVKKDFAISAPAPP
jgi:hypothetical protein